MQYDLSIFCLKHFGNGSSWMNVAPSDYLSQSLSNTLFASAWYYITSDRPGRIFFRFERGNEVIVPDYKRPGQGSPEKSAAFLRP